MLRRTPCVGICSTTYGDLVCRGCKRFAHEIVQWNGFDQDQRQAVWGRLLDLRAGAVGAVLAIFDESRLRESARRLGMTSGDGLDAANLAFELLQRLRWRDDAASLDALGIEVVEPAAGSIAAPSAIDLATLLERIEREFYLRSLAQYERNYRIPAE